MFVSLREERYYTSLRQGFRRKGRGVGDQERLILTHLKMSERKLESEQESAVLYRAAEHISIKYLDVSHVVTLLASMLKIRVICNLHNSGIFFLMDRFSSYGT